MGARDGRRRWAGESERLSGGEGEAERRRERGEGEGWWARTSAPPVCAAVASPGRKDVEKESAYRRVRRLSPTASGRGRGGVLSERAGERGERRREGPVAMRERVRTHTASAASLRRRLVGCTVAWRLRGGRALHGGCLLWSSKPAGRGGKQQPATKREGQAHEVWEAAPAQTTGINHFTTTETSACARGGTRLSNSLDSHAYAGCPCSPPVALAALPSRPVPSRYAPDPPRTHARGSIAQIFTSCDSF